jgi:hypothetical protein
VLNRELAWEVSIGLGVSMLCECVSEESGNIC